MTSSSSEPPPIRIGTKEREAAYAALNAHLDAGRLDADEYGERYAKASLARTRPEIEALFIDLPAPHPVLDDPPPAPSWVTSAPPRRRRLTPAAFALIPILALVLAVSTGFWFLFFLIPLGASVLGRGLGRGFGHGGFGGYRGYGGYGGYGGRGHHGHYGSHGPYGRSR